MPRASCAGSRKRLNSRSYFPYRDSRVETTQGTKVHQGNQLTAFFGVSSLVLCVLGGSGSIMSENTNLNIAVIGGGPGGYAAAFLAADLGMNVTLIDPELNPGGVCLYRGCIPSKALLHVAKLIDESRHAKNW